MKKDKLKCEICKRDSNSLVSKLSKKKGYEGLKMVCRICYDRLSEDEEEEEKNKKR